MALLKYKDLIAMAKDKLNECMAGVRAAEMKKKAELEIAKLDCEIAEKEQTTQEIAGKYPIDFFKLMDALDDVALAQRRKDQLSKIIDEMFAE